MGYNGERFVMYNCDVYLHVGECEVFDLKTGDIDYYDLDELHDIHEKYGIDIYGLDLYERNVRDYLYPDIFFLCIGDVSNGYVLKVGLNHLSLTDANISVEVFKKQKGKVFNYTFKYKDACERLAREEIKNGNHYKEEFDDLVSSTFEEFYAYLVVKDDNVKVFISQSVLHDGSYRRDSSEDNYVTELDLVPNKGKLKLDKRFDYKASCDDFWRKVRPFGKVINFD